MLDAPPPPFTQLLMALTEATRVSAPLGGDTAPLLAAGTEVRALLDQSTGPFRLGIVGEFRTGKSTLLNALAARALAYTDVREATPCILCFREGSEDQAIVHRHGGTLETLDLPTLNDRLSWWREDEEWVAAVDYVEVRAVAPGLHGLEIWDAPGIGGSEHNEQRARRFLDAISAAIWVVDAELLGAASVVDPITRLAGKPVLAVLNRVDGLEPDQVPEAVRFVRLMFGAGAVDVLPLSALEAWTAVSDGRRDPRLDALRRAIDERLIATTAQTRAAIIDRAGQRGAVATWRALDALRRPWAERIEVLDDLRARMTEGMAAVLGGVAPRIEAEVAGLWQSEERDWRSRLSELGRSLALPVGVLGGLTSAYSEILRSADEATSIEAGWATVADRVLETLRADWTARTRVAIEHVRAAAPEALLRVAPASEACPTAPPIAECDPEKAAVQEAIVTGSGAAVALGILAAASATLTWPIVLAAVPVGFIAGRWRRDREIGERQRALQNAAGETERSLKALLDGRRATLREALLQHLPQRLREHLEQRIAAAVEAEARALLGNVAPDAARQVATALGALQASLVELLEPDMQRVIRASVLDIPADADGLHAVDRILAETARLDLAVSGSHDGVASLAARLPADRSLRVLLLGNGSTSAGDAESLRKALSTIPARVDVRAAAETGDLGAAPFVCVTDHGAWQGSEPLDAIGQRPLRLLPFPAGRLVAARAFARAWSDPDVAR